MSLTHPSKPAAAPRSAATKIPPLENGDRLSRAEFERRYDAMPHVKKAELIDGVVYMASPISLAHAAPHGSAMAWMGFFAAATPIVELLGNVTVRLDDDNEVQPDAALRIRPEFGGQALDDGKYLVGAPELAVEIAATSASYDLHAKMQLYRRKGVREYIVWRSLDEILEWRILGDDGYSLLPPRSDGVFCSVVLPGLWLDAAALLAGDLAKVLAVAQAGVADSAHRNFLAARQAQATKSSVDDAR